MINHTTVSGEPGQAPTCAGSSISRVTWFNDPELVTTFGFPSVLPDTAQSR